MAYIPYDSNSVISTSDALIAKRSIDVSASSSFAECVCDITGGACDANCCCDPDCKDTIKERWKLNPLENCLEYYRLNQIVSFDDCKTEATRKKVTDIQDGLGYFTKITSLLMCAAKTGEPQDIRQFVQPISYANTSEQFDQIDQSKLQEFSPLFYSTVGQPSKLENYQTKKAYQPYEQLKGYFEYASGPMNLADQKLTIQKGGIFGECQQSSVLNFMEPSPQSSCSFLPKQLTKNFCENTLSMEQLFSMKVYKTGDKDSATIPVQAGLVLKYDYDNEDSFEQIKLNEDEAKVVFDKKGKASFSDIAGQSQICDDFVLQYELKIQYKPVAEATEASFTIEKVILNVVYGKIKTTGSQLKQIPRISKVNYFQNEGSRTASGMPGYHKALPIKTAQKVLKDDGNDYMQEPQQGMFFRGADNTGKCLSIPTPLASGQTFEKYVKEYVPQYFEDPQFTLEDSLIYGCHIDLDFKELKEFCSNKGYQNLLLFQNLNQTLKYIGKFGNSNPHYLSDWVQVSNEEVVGLNDQSEFKDDTGECQTMASSLFVNVYYQNIGRVEENQVEIVNVTMSWSKQYNQWKFDKPNKIQKQRFAAQINVEFYEIDRGIEFFVPKTPDVFKPVGLNFLYPFQRLQQKQST